MLQLYIDGRRVNLSEGVRTDYYIKNPFFTNEGDFTLDIDIDLRDPQNAMLYNYLDRMDRVRRSSRREAVLQDERGVLLRGQEVVLETRGGKAKIQIVGGASELNYVMSNRKLQDLDLWSEWDEDECVYVPVCAFNNSPHAEYGLMDSTQWVTENGRRRLVWKIVNEPKWRVSDNGLEYAREVPQPYIWAIVNRVIVALGFAVGDNVIQTDVRFSHMIMIHAYRTKYIADMLPRWTVSEFFDEIQKFFNVIVDVDKTTRRVSLTHAYDYFSSGFEMVAHDDVVNTVEKAFDKGSEMTMVDYSAVHYAFTDKTQNKYSALSDSLVQVCDHVQAASVSGGDSYSPRYNAGIWKAIEGDESFLSATSPTVRAEGAFGDRKIFHQTLNNEDVPFVLWSLDEDYTALKMVNRFGAKTSSREDVTDVALRIVPVRMVSSPVQGNSSQRWQYPLPAVDGEASSYGEVAFGNNVTRDNTSDINEDIKSGYDEKKEERADVLFAALYFGEQTINWEDPSAYSLSGMVVPIAAPDYMMQLHCLRGDRGDDLFWHSQRQVRIGFGHNDPMTMALNGSNGLYENYYALNPHVDTSVEYTIRFRTTGSHDVRKVWLISNRRFYCRELKYDISAGRRSEIAEGVFFPLTAAGQSEGGESVHYVTYNLSRVIIEHRVHSVMSNEPLHLDLAMEGGGNASATVHALVLMGNVDITSTAFTSYGRSGVIDIEHVTGDVYIQAWKA